MQKQNNYTHTVNKHYTKKRAEPAKEEKTAIEPGTEKPTTKKN